MQGRPVEPVLRAFALNHGTAGAAGALLGP